MKDKFYELFPSGICFDTAGHGTLMQDRYNELDDEKINYIETATYMHHEMYEMLDTMSTFRNSYSADELMQYFLDNSDDIDRLLAKARGEHE